MEVTHKVHLFAHNGEQSNHDVFLKVSPVELECIAGFLPELESIKDDTAFAVAGELRNAAFMSAYIQARVEEREPPE